MKAYIIAYTSGTYMVPMHDKVYKSRGTAQKKCDQMNEERSVDNKLSVLCADNWHKE